MLSCAKVDINCSDQMCVEPVRLTVYALLRPFTHT